VAGDEGERRPDVTGELLVVGAAQTAGLDGQKTVVGTDVGQGQPALLEVPRPGEDQSFCRFDDASCGLP